MMPIASRFSILILLLLVLFDNHPVEADSTLWYHSSDTNNSNVTKELGSSLYTPTSSVFVGPQSFSVQAPLTLVNPENACKSINNDIDGHIALVFGQMCSFETQLRNIQDSGGVGMVWVSGRTSFWGDWGTSREVVGAFVRTKDGSSRNDLNIPLVEINPQDIEEALDILEQTDSNEEADGIVEMLLQPSQNPYIAMNDSLAWTILFKGVFPVIAALNVILAAYRLFTFFRFLDKAKRRQLWLPQLVLVLEMFANLERVIYLSLDPVFSTGRITYAANMMTITIHQPFCLVTTVMVAVFWSSLRKENSLSKISVFARHKKLLVVIIASLFVVDITLSILRALYFSIGALGSISGIAYSLTVLLIAAILIYLSSSALSQSRVRSTIARRRKRSSVLVTFMFMASGFTLIPASIGWFMVSLPQLWTPTGWIVAWSLNWTSFVLTSFFQILVIQPQTKNGRENSKVSSLARGTAGSTSKPFSQQTSSKLQFSTASKLDPTTKTNLEPSPLCEDMESQELESQELQHETITSNLDLKVSSSFGKMFVDGDGNDVALATRIDMTGACIEFGTEEETPTSPSRNCSNSCVLNE